MRLSPLDAWFRDFPLTPADDHALLRFEDLSSRSRFGCTGPGAETWLAAGGFHAPPEPNSAVIDADRILVARLATSEYLIEGADGVKGRVESTLRQLTSGVRPRDVYPVPRQDFVIGIEGAAVNALLGQTCSVDFAPLLNRCGRDAGPIILTSMIGVSVLVFVRRAAENPALILWVDPSFAHYFWTTLLEVGRDLQTN